MYAVDWQLESQDINKMTEAGFTCMLLIGNWNHKTFRLTEVVFLAV